MGISLTNQPLDILSSWLALEVLSPQTFQRPDNLGPVIHFSKNGLPWETGDETRKPNYRLYYQVVVGTIDFEKAVAALLEVYTDKRAERPAAKGEAILAAFTVDAGGIVVGAPVISSFGWGLGCALRGALNDIVQWPDVEKVLNAEVDDILKVKDEEGNQLPVRELAIQSVRDTLIKAFKLPAAYVTSNSFAVRVFQYVKNQEPPEPLLLNSFFLGDLTIARELFTRKKAPDNLLRYLKARAPEKRTDILHDTGSLEQVISPDMIPPSRWPGQGRHPLVLLQQAAVNIAMKELDKGGILAVNGPPGTGKTTLLRDVIAGVVLKRAEAMATFANPADAFEDSGEKLMFGSAAVKLFQVAPKIKGFEMLIASSNNKAVENVSAELPGMQAIADDANDLRYFSGLSGALLGRDSWGIIAAVLGNASNLNTFKQTFWWDKDWGLAAYLTEACGMPQLIEEKDAQGNIVIRKPHIIAMENPPNNHEDALFRWKEIKREFRELLRKVNARLKQLEDIRQDVLKLAGLEEKEEKAEQALAEAVRNLEELGIIDEGMQNRFAQVAAMLKQAMSNLSGCFHSRPNWLARLFRTQSARAWRNEYEQLDVEKELAEREYLKIEAAAEKSGRAYQRAVRTHKQLSDEYQNALVELEKLRKRIEVYRKELGAHLIDRSFFRLPHEARHLVSPWCDRETQLLRDSVFVKAVQLHKAFIDAAAKPIKHNLNALVSNFYGQGLTSDRQKQLLPDLWTTLFLVVPALSTTFASVGKMLGKLPSGSLGWLLIDEAGQALPQAAVGAMMRARRAIVVGDPMQIEPVVVLPELLTQNICRSFGVDPLVFNAPASSAQTLADAATSYFAEFEGKTGSRTVGVPLLVHRRCEDPMFSISNTIAYERLMVKAKATAKSPIRDCIGVSAWIDVESRATDNKWSLDEGMALLKLLEKLKAAGVTPDMYIVTPFVLVAENVRRLLRESDILMDWVDEPETWPTRHVGTVHTVQGREAEAVFFILGAPSQPLFGARGWAGGKPNLVNVAVTRAKEVVYVIGNRGLWKTAGVFSELVDRLPVRSV